MAVLTFNGNFFRFEVQEIDDDDAKDMKSDGIDASDLEDMDFEDEAEEGICGQISVLVDDKRVAEIDITSLEVSSIEDSPDYWHILKIQRGSCTYGPFEVDGDFDVNVVNFGTYIKKVGKLENRYAWPLYNEEDVEKLSESVDQVEYFLVSPKGKIHNLEIN